MRLQLSKLNESLGETPETFICPVSYESRCLSVARIVTQKNLENILFLYNSDYESQITENLSALKQLFIGVSTEVEMRTDDPIATADNLMSKVVPVINQTTELCLIDITTFTHEQLLILTRLLIEVAPGKRIKFVYTGADEYSTNHHEADKWLSKGVSNIRTVLGYPGIMLPSQKLHLIILTGFEAERAETLIFNAEPALLTLGLGARGQSVSEKLHKTNYVFHKRVEDFVQETLNSLESVQQFDFSCVDPIQAMNDIIGAVDKFPTYNVAICPLNTKPSTLGAALAATKYERIQIIYAQPAEYNTIGYSRPSEECTLFDFRELIDSLK